MAMGLSKSTIERSLKGKCHLGIHAMRLEAYTAFCIIGPKNLGVDANSAQEVKAASDAFAEEVFERHASPTWKNHRKELRARGLSE